MLRNHIVVAIRCLLRYKAITLINIAGLAVGMMSCILILTLVQHELSYDGMVADKLRQSIGTNALAGFCGQFAHHEDFFQRADRRTTDAFVAQHNTRCRACADEQRGYRRCDPEL